ncbi:MAG: aminotransferase class IV [Bacteroidia bacterium]|nr:aminotransferase class IV [Bacteroidia bacterium]
MLDTYCIYNGHLISLYEPAIGFSNRAFRYGDSLFESIRYTNGRIMFLADHVKRIKLSMTILRMNVPVEFTTLNIEQLIIHLLEQNNIKKEARIRLTVFRNEGGLYTPDTNDISFLIETEALETSGYIINQKGLWVDVYAEIKKPINKISNLKTGSALLYVMAGITKTSLKLDDCLLVNDNGNIIESISSNIFVVKNGTIYTSPITDGCIDGVMRKQILDLAAQNKILAFEQPLTVHTLTNGDEVFLTNAIKGVQWVGQFKNKFYTNQKAVFFADKLNELVK